MHKITYRKKKLTLRKYPGQWKKHSAMKYQTFIFIIKYGCRIKMGKVSSAMGNGRS